MLTQLPAFRGYTESECQRKCGEAVRLLGRKGIVHYSAPDRRAVYCDESGCLSVCLSVCVCLSVRDHIFGTTRLIFTKLLCMLPTAMARSSSGGVVIRYVLPVYG